MEEKAPVPAGFKSGFVALIGEPNVGKSTLLNQLVKHKLAIVSPKPQTTRSRILGVLTDETSQLIFWDTPGICEPKHKLDQRMVNTAFHTLQEVDVVVLMVEPAKEISVTNQDVIRLLKSKASKACLVINKVDIVPKPQLLPIIDSYHQLLDWQAIVPISALSGDGVERLLAELRAALPEGPKYFPDDTLTDQPERFIMAEIVREKIFLLTRQEIPYSSAVVIEEMKERPEEGLVYLRGTVYVERESQKGIIIGNRGEMIKKIGQAARAEMEFLLGTKVYLDLWVKVRRDWRDNPAMLSSFGY